MGQADTSFRPDIEGLRAVAILGVVLYHAGVPGFGGGFVGVDLFFVLSGFLITGLLVREVERTGRIRLADFWARRVRRLLPAATVVLVAVAVAGQVVVAPCDRREAGLGVDAAALYVANWLFVRRHLDYLAADDAPSPVLHTWSLAVEEQFYAVWPLLVVFATLGAGDARAVRRRLLAGISVVVVGSLAASVVFTRSWQPFAFFGSPTRFWQLGAGALLAIATAGPDRALGARAAAALGTAGLGALLLAIVATDRLTELGMGYPGVLAALPVAGTAAIVAAGGAPWWGLPVLASAPMRWLGRMSYAWYLWHWPALLLAPEGAGTPTALALAAMALLLAWATHHLVENPVRFSPRLARAPAASLALGAALTATSVVAGEALRRNDLRRVEAGALAGAAPYRPLQAEARDDVPVLYRNGCHLGFLEDESPACTFGAGSGPRVVLFGDSHATNLFPPLEAAAADAGWRVVARVKSSCSPASATMWDGRRRQPYRECDRWRERVLTELERDPVDLVLVATIERTEDRVVGPDGQLSSGDAAAPIWAEALSRTLARLAATGADVVFVRDNPRAPRSALRCWSWAPLEWDRCAFARDTGPEANLAAARGVPGVRILDLDDAVCRGGRCVLVVDGRTVYRDTHHYTATFSGSLAPRLRAVLAGG